MAKFPTFENNIHILILYKSVAIQKNRAFLRNSYCIKQIMRTASEV
jgi:hypothetical protein